MTKKPRTIIKELRADLRFAQMHVRQDISALKRSRAKVKEIAARMRELQRLDGQSAKASH